MLAKLKNFFETELRFNEKDDTEQDHTAKLQQACAILLIEITKADYQETAEEKAKVKSILKKEFALTDDKLNELIDISESEGEGLTSVYPFTNLINDQYDYPEKVNLIRLMWRVAYADGDLSKYEDHLIRKVAELLYISHSDFIQAKLSESGEPTAS
jgi:uncharacterized tellurite resistance protein B-like protein